MRQFSSAVLFLALSASLSFPGCSGSAKDSEEVSNQASSSVEAEARKTLFRAVTLGKSDEVQALLKQGVAINGGPILRGQNQITPLMAAIILGKKEIASLLILRGASLAPAFHGYSARDLAFLLNQMDLIVLMEKGTHL